MSGIEVVGLAVGVVAVVAQVISAYRDGGGIVDRIKQKRAARRERPLPRDLEESIKGTPEDIEREQNHGLRKFGTRFEQGDAIAIITIQQIAIQIHSSFFEKLRNAYDEDTDFTPLIRDADNGRDSTLRALIELQQRLAIAAPIPQAPSQQLPQRHMFPSESGAQVGMAQLGTFPIVEHQNRNLLEPASPYEPARDAPMPVPPRDQRQHRFNLFHRSRENSHPRQGSADQSPDPGQGGFQRIFTLPTNSNSTLDVAVQPQRFVNPTPQARAPATSPPLPNFRQSPAQSPDPCEYNPWAEDARSPRQSTLIQPDAATRMPPPTNAGFTAPPMRTSTSQSGSSTHSIPHPNPSNNYLGFCKGAWKLQDGDKKAMTVSRDYTLAASSSVRMLRCSECHFVGHFNPDNIWDRVFKFESLGMKSRWAFLAKSHVKQRYPLKREDAVKCNYTYQCIFCAFLGYQIPAIAGAQEYRQHVSTHHHGIALSDLVLYKANAVNDRICDDKEDFDINLYPRRDSGMSELSGRSFYP